MEGNFCPLSARTTARQKMRVARRKASLLHNSGRYSKYQGLCNIVQKKCGLTESQVQRELGKFFLKSCKYKNSKIPLQRSFWKHVRKGWWQNESLWTSQLWHWEGNLNFWPMPYLGLSYFHQKPNLRQGFNQYLQCLLPSHILCQKPIIVLFLLIPMKVILLECLTMTILAQWTLQNICLPSTLQILILHRHVSSSYVVFSLYHRSRYVHRKNSIGCLTFLIKMEGALFLLTKSKTF